MVRAWFWVIVNSLVVLAPTQAQAVAWGTGGSCLSGWGIAGPDGRIVEAGKIDPSTGRITMQDGRGQVIGWGWVLPDGTTAELFYADGRPWKRVVLSPQPCVLPRPVPKRISPWPEPDEWRRLVPIWDSGQTVNPLRRYESPEPR